MPLLDSIKKREDFVNLNNKMAAKVISGGFILLMGKTPLKRIEKNTELQKFSRFGITVTKKISKKAVIRNKIRRRLRETIRKNLINLGQEKFDYVFIARNFIINMDFSKLLEDVQNAILKANRQANNSKQ